MSLRAASNLRNPTTFPRFAAICAEHGPNSTYWSSRLPRRQWAFLGEIIPGSNFLVRLLLLTCGLDGQPVHIAMYTPDHGKKLGKKCVVGHTVVVFFPEQHYFLDGTVGFRVEDRRRIKIIPFSLAELVAANDRLFEEKPTCMTCAKSVAQPMRCTKCQGVYCGAACRRAGLARHQHECQVSQAVLELTQRDWESPGTAAAWGVVSKYSEEEKEWIRKNVRVRARRQKGGWIPLGVVAVVMLVFLYFCFW